MHTFSFIFLPLLAVVALGYPKNEHQKKREECKIMHNIGYVLNGYNIYLGNPVPIGRDKIDPGFAQHIFTAKYNGQTSEDQQYCAPDGLEILSCSDSCNFDFFTSTISGKETYSKTLDLKASIPIGVPKVNGSFGASAEFKHIESETSTHANIFMQAETSCCAYKVSIWEYVSPEFHPNFIGGVDSLTEEYDENIYRKFMENFGTHFVKEATLGAIYGQQSEISRESYSEMSQNYIDIALWAKIAAVGDLNMTSSAIWNQTAANEFAKYVAEKKVYSRGKVPPKSGDTNDWMDGSIENPFPLDIKILPIHELPNIDEIMAPKVKENLKMALNDYCKVLLSEGRLSTCDLYEPDPPLPKPRVWTKWSTGQNQGRDTPVMECAEGEFVDVVIWRYAGNNKGTSNMMLKCSDGSWKTDATGDDSGDWDNPMVCKSGFRQMTARSNGWSGVLNVQAFCKGSETELTSNDDMAGEYGEDLNCKNKQIVGIQLNREGFHGVLNMRVLCA